MRRTYHRDIGIDPLLFSASADDRVRAAATVTRRARRTLEARAAGWPPYSPASINAWLLLVTTKPPAWRDPLVQWEERPPTLGEAHQGFFYPDPLGFWAEIRRWSLELLRLHQPEFQLQEALSLTTLLHLGDEPQRLQRAIDLSSPQLLLFLDGPAWETSGLESRNEAHHIIDPHRPGQVYEGLWGRTDDGRVVGKSPQHPTMHNLYKAEDMLGYLRAAPLPGLPTPPPADDRPTRSGTGRRGGRPGSAAAARR